MGKKIYVLGIAIICLLTLMQLPDAYYHKVFGQEELECELGKKFRVDEKDSAGGKFVAAPEFSFDRGDYVVTVNYAAEAKGNYITLQSQIGQDGKIVQETHELPVAISWGMQKIPLHLDSYTEALGMEVYYGGEGELQLFSITVDGLEWKPQDILAIGFLVLACYLLAGYLLFRDHGLGERSGVYLVLLAAAVFSSYPLFFNSLVRRGDITFHLMRIVGIRDGLLSGQFPVRVYPSAFYGSGCAYSMFYPDLFLYIPAILCLFGCSLVVSVQIFGFLIHLAAAWIMYYAVRKLGASRTAGLLSSILYVFSMYFSMNLYFRFDFGEALAMCFFPLVICGFYEAVFQEEGSFWPLCLGMSGLLMSHMLSTVFAAVFLVIFGMVFIRKVLQKKALVRLAKAAAVAFGLCVWFLAPFLQMSGESTNIALMQRATHENALDVGMLFTVFGKGSKNDPRNLGFALVFGMLICVCCLLGRAHLEAGESGMLSVFLAAGVGIALCATPLFPWKAMMESRIFSGFTGLVQFPWRLLGPASAFLSLASGMAIAAFWKEVKQETLLSIVFAVSLVFFAFSIETIYMETDPYIGRGDAVQKTAVAEDYLHQKTETKKLRQTKADAHGMEILKYEKRGSNIQMEVDAKAGSYVDTSLLFFLGYKAFDREGNKLVCVSGENNRLRIEFPEGYRGEVTVRYTGITRWRLSDLVSLVTLIAAIWFAVRRGYEKSGRPQGTGDARVAGFGAKIS